MAYKGRYKPNNPSKYRGNVHNVIYRSLWERKFMVYCDNNESVIEWGSEEVVIPYKSPWDGRIHRYFPDFYCKIRKHDGSVERIQPRKPVFDPPKKVGRSGDPAFDWAVPSAEHVVSRTRTLHDPQRSGREEVACAPECAAGLRVVQSPHGSAGHAVGLPC